MAEMKILFCLSSSMTMDFRLIEDALKVSPTKTRRKNEFPQQSIDAGFAKDVWSIIISFKDIASVSYSLDELYNILGNKESIIRLLCEKYKLKASVEVIVHAQDEVSMPEIYLSRNNIMFLNSIDAEFSMDIYLNE